MKSTKRIRRKDNIIQRYHVGKNIRENVNYALKREYAIQKDSFISVSEMPAGWKQTSKELYYRGYVFMKDKRFSVSMSELKPLRAVYSPYNKEQINYKQSIFFPDFEVIIYCPAVKEGYNIIERSNNQTNIKKIMIKYMELVNSGRFTTKRDFDMNLTELKGQLSRLNYFT